MTNMTEVIDERGEELESLCAIFPELTVEAQSQHHIFATLEIAVTPHQPLLIRFTPSETASDFGPHDLPSRSVYARKAFVEQDLQFAHLPPLMLRIELGSQYPAEAPPMVHLSTRHDWLPNLKMKELEHDVVRLWEDYGRCQILYVYIDHLQQAAERGFDLNECSEGCLNLTYAAHGSLVRFNMDMRKQAFETSTYDCGVCLDPKKGTGCYQMDKCGHVFCRQCLQDFYNNAITEGDVSGVKCMDPDCGVDGKGHSRTKQKRKERLLHPSELLDMGLEEPMVRRYVEMKRKKRLEADQSTVYCPRTWCQGAAKSEKYPPIPVDLRAYVPDAPSSNEDSDHEESPEEDAKPKPAPDPFDRLSVCEKCSLAFCNVCYLGWHGPYGYCFPRDPNELSAEEKASYEFIRLNTSPCPYCNAPVQKTMGCNHMRCFQCYTHFCYLCGAYLSANNPYQHFNTQGTKCFQRLWELEEGEGQAPRNEERDEDRARAWELALDAAQEAEAAEAEIAATAAQAERDAAAPLELHAAHRPIEPEMPLVLAMANVQLVRNQPLPVAAQERRERRPRNPFPRPPAGREAHARAQAVRNHERAGRAQPAVVARVGERDELDDRQQAELHRFLELAERDEEDDWDSDELGDEELFIIR